MKLHELIDKGELDEALEESLVFESSFGKVSILNYSQTAMFNNLWNSATMNSRGLIYDNETLEVLARPWKKFFNLGQLGCAEIALDEPVEVTDKMDGSLIIAFRDREGRVRCATKGSLNSDMAIHAMPILERNGIENMPNGITPLFEVIYPENRIVLDYNGLDDVFLLGGVVIETGEVLSPNDSRLNFYLGPRTQVFEDKTLLEALARPPRKNAEGLIVRSLKTGNMVKIKQEDYVAMHRAIFGVTRKKVWKLLGDFGYGSNLDCLAVFPDEIHKEVKSYAETLVKKASGIKSEILQEIKALEQLFLKKGVLSKKEKVLLMQEMVKEGTLSKTAMSSFLSDCNRLDKLVWELVRPVNEPSSLPFA